MQIFFIQVLSRRTSILGRFSVGNCVAASPENKQFPAVSYNRATKWGQEDSGRVRQEFISRARSRATDDTSQCFIAVREILSGVSARGNAAPRRARKGIEWVETYERGDRTKPGRSANVPIRMSFVFFVSWLVCSTVTLRKEGVPDEYEGWWRSRWHGWRALIYRGNRSLFLSRRPSRPPHLDRYRLVIGFRYLNISAQWNLSDWIGGIYGKQEASMMLNILRVYTLLRAPIAYAIYIV